MCGCGWAAGTGDGEMVNGQNSRFHSVLHLQRETKMGKGLHELYRSERASLGMERELTRDTRQHLVTLCVLLRPETMSLVSTWVCGFLQLLLSSFRRRGSRLQESYKLRHEHSSYSGYTTR